jgi:hypothetical protein
VAARVDWDSKAKMRRLVAVNYCFVGGIVEKKSFGSCYSIFWRPQENLMSLLRMLAMTYTLSLSASLERGTELTAATILGAFLAGWKRATSGVWRGMGFEILSQ